MNDNPNRNFADRYRLIISFLALNIPVICVILMLNMSRKAMVPDNSGETTQLAAIEPTFAHLTASNPIPTAANPTIAPTME